MYDPKYFIIVIVKKVTYMWNKIIGFNMLRISFFQNECNNNDLAPLLLNCHNPRWLWTLQSGKVVELEWKDETKQ